MPLQPDSSLIACFHTVELFPSERLAKAQEIASNPGEYQVCEGCESIVGLETIICPNCHSYRFDEDPIRVVDQAIVLGSREKRSVTAEDLA